MLPPCQILGLAPCVWLNGDRHCAIRIHRDRHPKPTDHICRLLSFKIAQCYEHWAFCFLSRNLRGKENPKFNSAIKTRNLFQRKRKAPNAGDNRRAQSTVKAKFSMKDCLIARPVQPLVRFRRCHPLSASNSANRINQLPARRLASILA